MRLEPLMTYHADLLTPVAVGAGPYGNRLIVEVAGGAFEGPRLRGRILTGGGDWLLVDAEGVGHLDVPLQTRDLTVEANRDRACVPRPGMPTLDVGGLAGHLGPEALEFGKSLARVLDPPRARQR